MNRFQRKFQTSSDQGRRSIASAFTLIVGSVAVITATWASRGAGVGLLAAGLCAAVVVPFVLGGTALKRWSEKHVALDALFSVPLTFAVLTCATSLDVWLSLIASVCVGAVVVPVALRRRVQHG